MVSQTCDQCGASVAADEQFCPECGSFIDPMSPPRSHGHGPVISVSSDGSYEEFSLDEQPPPEDDEEPAVPPPVTTKTTGCPSCGAINPAGNRHCQECGARLSQDPLPTAPRPAVQATAGVRAALAISGLLFVVIVIALLFNFFGGEDVASDTTVQATTTTQPSVQEPAKIDILLVECSQPGLGSFTCENLVSGTDDEYQVNWEELVAAEEALTIKLVFDRPMTVTRLDWTGISDPDRFRQNFRARGLTVKADDSFTDHAIELADTPGIQTERYATLNANWVEITVQSAYLAEVVGGNVFRELAITEIELWGYPTNLTSDTTSDG